MSIAKETLEHQENFVVVGSHVYHEPIIKHMDIDGSFVTDEKICIAIEFALKPFLFFFD